MKEKRKGRERQDVDTLGDAYTYVAIERNSKLILAWHLGRRNMRDTLTFMLKLRRATEGKFQLTTDGWTAYPDAVERVFGNAVDFAQMVNAKWSTIRETVLSWSLPSSVRIRSAASTSSSRSGIAATWCNV